MVVGQLEKMLVLFYLWKWRIAHESKSQGGFLISLQPRSVNSFEGFKLCSVELWNSTEVCLDSMGVIFSDRVNLYFL